jgi:type II secretory ATPase GspE/PulE/Tfp pilus assembly ATPase PilB-like protein
MTTQTVKPTRLVNTIHALLERFRNELTGARQATRTQLIQFIARHLEISQDAAGKLFDDLRQAGVIVRGDEPLTDASLPDRDDQQWSIHAGDDNDSVSHLESQLRPTKDVVREPQALDLLRRAITHRATDVHLDPFGDETEVRFRIDGRLEHYCRLSESIGEQLMSQLKVLANLDPSEPFHPHEGRLELPIALSDYDVRITTTPVVSGDAVALRILRREQILRPLDSLGLNYVLLAQVRELLCHGEGMLLVSGPSGAGKTTTLYSLVHHLDDGHKNIVTIEDPVEYLVPGLAQLQIDPKHDLSFAAGLRTALRMDADVMLLSEIRDAVTAAAAMRASSSGKYVFSTFHTRDAASVVTGMRDLQVDDRSLASNLRAIIAQRLVRRICKNCGDTQPIRDDQVERFTTNGVTPPEHLPHAVGCDACQQLGYRERIGVFEVAVVTPEIAAAIESGKSEHELRDLLGTSGASSLMSDGLQKVCDGITTLEEIAAVSCL